MNTRNFKFLVIGIGIILFLAVMNRHALTSLPTSRTLATAEDVTPATPFLDDANQCTSFSNPVTPDQQAVINDLMANHPHRLYHALWHATRNSWDSLTADQRAVLVQLSPSWGKNAPLCDQVQPVVVSIHAYDHYLSDKAPTVSVAGEEFLLMHHGMVESVKNALVAKHLACIAPWTTLPAKDDAVWPVPAGKKDDSFKTDLEGSRLNSWATILHSKEFLSGKSLSYVGVIVEFTLHNHLHMRWAQLPKPGDDFSSTDASDFSPKNLLSTTRYDGPEHNWLGNPYGAHINPVFWKLHGWVDDTIKLWLDANGFTSIAKDCTGRGPKCYQWNSTWVGEMVTADQHMSAMPGMPRGTMGHVNPEEQSHDPKAATLLKEILSKAQFGNAAFSRDELEAKFRVQATAPGQARGPDPLDNPETYLAKYGPCSSN